MAAALSVSRAGEGLGPAGEPASCSVNPTLGDEGSRLHKDLHRRSRQLGFCHF